MKTINVKFTDLPSELDIENNYIVRLLKKHYNLNFTDEPDFLFYAAFGYDYQNYKDKQCVRIFLGGEPLVPNFNDCDYAMGHAPIQFADRYMQISTILASPFERGLSRDMQDTSAVTDDMLDRKFCNFVYSNDLPHSGWKVRKEFCQKLMTEYKHVDCPGRVLNNMPSDSIAPRWVKGKDGKETVPPTEAWIVGKLDFLKNYKFTIAFENAFMPGYTTEKLVDPFLSHSIPIYWGNPEVTKYYNPKAFINCNDYDNDFDAVIKRVIELDNDKEQYLQMLREPPMNEDFAFDEVDRFEKWLCHIIEKGPHPLSKNPAGFVPVSCPQQFEFIFNEYCSRGEALKIYQNSNIWNIAMGIKKFGDSKWGVVPKKVYHFYLKHKKK